MKQLFAVFVILSLCGISYADYTYEAVGGNVGKITKTETVTTITPDNVTIESLNESIARLNREKADALTNYNNLIAQKNKEIAQLEAHKKALKALGVTEVKAVIIQ